MSIPNILSIFRILLIPVFSIVYLCLPQEQFIWAAVILIISGLTDLLDGYIARHFNMVTQLGKWLDPIADKLTQAIVCATLAIRRPELIVLLVVYVVKEVLMLIGGLLIHKSGTKLPSSKWYGKVATCIAYLVLFLIIVKADMAPPVLYCLIFIAIIFTLLALFMYIPEYIRLNKKQ